MKLLFLGDFYYDYDYITEDIKRISKYIKDNNLITILNLEGTIKSSFKVNKGIRLNFSDIFIEVLKMLNVRAVNIANNHVMDFGSEGLKKLINMLDEAGIGHFGAGLNLEKALEVYTVSLNEKTISFGGYGWNMEECINARKGKAGTSPINFKLISKIIDDTKCDLFIPIFHYGYEFEKLPQPYHLLNTRELLNNKKVKIIIGHHPHVVQAFEENIYYSLGNFYFGSKRHMFYNNKKYSKETGFGIGVIYDIDNNQKEVIEFIFDGTSTNIFNNTVELIDISNIKTSDYTKYFYDNNNILNKKYVYKMGFLNEKIFNYLKYYKRTFYKYYLRHIKWPLIKLVKGLRKR